MSRAGLYPHATLFVEYGLADSGELQAFLFDATAITSTGTKRFGAVYFGPPILNLSQTAMSSFNLLDPEWFAAAFAATNAVRALFYIPQIIAIARSVDGARDISLSTWWMWAINNALGALYTGVTMDHQALALSFWASAAACVGTIALTLRARKRHSSAMETST